MYIWIHVCIRVYILFFSAYEYRAEGFIIIKSKKFPTRKDCGSVKEMTPAWALLKSRACIMTQLIKARIYL